MTQADRIRQLHDAGWSNARIQSELGVATGTIWSALHRRKRIGRPRADICWACGQPKPKAEKH